VKKNRGDFAGDKITCVTVPDFPVEVCRRRHPETNAVPLALAESELDDAELIALDSKAVASGLMLHITAAQGHILCPELTVKVRDREQEIEPSNHIYKKLQAFSPFVEEARPGLYFLDSSGLELLYPDDTRFADRLIAAVRSAGEPPYPVRVGIGRNKLIAQLAADRSDLGGFIVVPPRMEKKFLQPLPLETLQTDQFHLTGGTLSSLHDLGLRTIGQVAAFPANEMIRRFGVRGEMLARLARGDDVDFFTPDQPTESLTTTVWLDDPTDQAEAIVGLARNMLAGLLEELGRYSRGCAVIEIGLHLDRRNTRTLPLSVAVERPTLSRAMFLRQLQTVLERQPLPAPVNGLTLTIPATAGLRSEQLLLHDSFQTASHNPDGRTDNPGVTVPVKHDFFLPEQKLVFAAPTVALPPPPTEPRPVWADRCAYTSITVNGLRLVRPAKEIEVVLEHDRPVTIRRTLVTGLGPWELSGQWWSRGYDRHYWEVHTDHRRRFLIYHDRLLDRWFLQGVFD
jgi:nucleotidyltransferase/DNA polymerase involved in DNA repair